MASSSKQIQPATYGGRGQNPNQPRGGLFKQSFDSNCPPVITPDTIILAVCGPNDVGDNAAPDADGWFIADFYLFHHLFRNTTKHQYWLTCVKPEDLVRKYTEFVHGDPRSNDRRVVLDKTFAEEVRDVIVFHPEDLLEKFLSHLANICRSSKDAKSPILVMIFGHGHEETFSINIGGHSENVELCPKLDQAHFKQAIHRHDNSPNVALVTTSCFGAGWTQTGLLDITAMAGSADKTLTLSWPRSESMDRCCGSKYAIAVAEALIRSEIRDLDIFIEEQMHQSSTYEALVDSINDTLGHEVVARPDKNISFSAKDDLWGTEWRARTGFPLTSYREKWEMLRSIPTSSSSSNSLSGSVKFTDYIHLSKSAAEFRIKRLAYDYMTSKPGEGSAAKNHRVHAHCHQLLKGNTVSKEELEILAASLHYRLKTVMARATEYKDHLRISFPDCHLTDVDSLRIEINEHKDSAARLSAVRSLVYRSYLFDEACEDEGHDYCKGYIYLAIVLTQSKMSYSEIEEAVAGLVRYKQETSPVEITMRAFRFWEVPEIHDMLETLAKDFDKPLRSQSPSEEQF